MIPDPWLLTEIPELFVVKLLSVVRNNHPRDPKPTNNISLDKVLYLGFCDYCERFCLHPFREIINSDD